MPSAERAFTLQLMQENEQLQSSLGILVSLAQHQHALAALEGHPFPIDQLEGNLMPEQVQQMILFLKAKIEALEKEQKETKPPLALVEGEQRGNGTTNVRPRTEV